jgi:uncharacterized repeat protein (TIGR03803 family)
MTISGPCCGCASRGLFLTLVLVALLLAIPSAHAQTFTILYSFLGPPDGGGPNGVIRDAEGNLYGTTYWGGVSYHGAAFKLAPDGKETILYSFLGGYGWGPDWPLTQDAQGTLYGTTIHGGFYGNGAVFKLDKKGNETVLYSFKGHSDGLWPSGVIVDEMGNLYGTTPWGGGGTGCGGTGCGTVFKLDTSGRKTVLYAFADGTDGGLPYSGLMRDKAGNLYGTTSLGGDLSCDYGYGCGTVFMLDSAGHEKTLYGFAGGTDGSQPYAGVIRDDAGNFYGTTAEGGDSSCNRGLGCGTVFRLAANGNETVLHSFTGTGGDGAYPYAGVVRDPKGNLYGTTSGGGDPNCSYGQGNCGTVFMVNPAGKETVLHSFAGNPDGAYPSGLIRDASGNLYGSAAAAGTSNCRARYFGSCGTVFKLTP